MDKGTYIAGIGGKPKKQKKVKGESSTSNPNRMFQEVFGRSTIRKDWTDEAGVIGEVLNQRRKDICWAIVFARLMQAIYNYGKAIALQVQFSFLDLINIIKPSETEQFMVSNYRRIIAYVATEGMLKMPIRESNEKAGKGQRIPEQFQHLLNVNVETIIEKVNRHPIGLILEATAELNYVNEGIYYPLKKGITENVDFHIMLIIGWGETREEEKYLIGQNSYGEEWGFKGYARIVLEENYDIICVVE